MQGTKVGRMTNEELIRGNNLSKAVLGCMIFVIFFMGMRHDGIGADTALYSTNFRKMSRGVLEPTGEEGDWVFYYYQYTCSQLMSRTMWLISVAVFYVGAVFVACRYFVRNNATTMLLIAMGAFSFFSYGTNGIRNGVATSFMVLAMALIVENGMKNKVLCAFFCFLALGCHKSTALPIAAMLFARYIKFPRGMFYLWAMSIVLSLIVGQAFTNIFMLFGFDARISGYVNMDNTGETEDAIAKAGFRWDFLLYSAMPIILGYYTIVKKKLYDKTYLLLMGTYIYANAVWVMLIRLPFSNRFAYLSWFLYGIVLAYPLLKFNIWPRQGKKVKLIMLAHVGFTFFMWYYTGL